MLPFLQYETYSNLLIVRPFAPSPLQRLLHYYGLCLLLTVRCYWADKTPVRPPHLRCTLFPLIYPPHLLVLPATLGLHLFWQTYPYFRALYAVPVRQVRGLLTASFRFRLTADTLAVRLCASLLPTRTWDFHPLENAHAGQTKGRPLGPPRHINP